MPSTTAFLRKSTAEAIDAFAEYPANCFEGRGIVMCAGGPAYFVQAWVNIRLIRQLGCTLPIELWHRDDAEMTPTMRSMLHGQGVVCVNASEIARDQETARLPGWAIKPFSVLHSRFREVLYLDSDSLPVRDPEYLFADRSYRRSGSLFWTDRYRGETSAYGTVNPHAWEVMNVPRREEPECESGQMLIDKARVWRELNLCLYFNHNADAYYQYVYGDKDTFRFAWHRLGREFNTVPFGPSSPPNFRVLFQLDPSGQVIFQHRARAKWTVEQENHCVAGFQHEDACLSFVDEVRQVWDDIIHEWHQGGSDRLRIERETLQSTKSYACSLNDRVVGKVRFENGGLVTSDLKQLPSHWQLVEHPDQTIGLALMGDRAAPIMLEPDRDGWIGNRVAGNRERIRLSPIEAKVADQDLNDPVRIRMLDGLSESVPVKSTPAMNANVDFDCQLVSPPSQSVHRLVVQTSPTNEIPGKGVTSVQPANVGVNLESIRNGFEPTVQQGDSEVWSGQSAAFVASDVRSAPHAAAEASWSFSAPPALANFQVLHSISVRSHGLASGDDALVMRHADATVPAQSTSRQTQSSADSYLKIYGLPRSCTNLLSHLLRHNFQTHVFQNELGWKHGPNLCCQGDQIDGHPLKFIVCVRHPYSWLASFYRFERQGRRIHCSFPDFVLGSSHTYQGRNPIDRYNLLVRMWLGLAIDPDYAQVVRSESILDDQTAVLATLENQLGLTRRAKDLAHERRRIGPDEAIRDREFDPSYYQSHRYMALYDNELLRCVNDRLDRDLISSLQYRLLDEVPVPLKAGRS